MQGKIKNKSVEKSESKDVAASSLVCVRDCFAPGLGGWKTGDIVKEAKLIKYLKGNINFKAHGGNK